MCWHDIKMGNIRPYHSRHVIPLQEINRHSQFTDSHSCYRLTCLYDKLHNKFRRNVQQNWMILLHDHYPFYILLETGSSQNINHAYTLICIIIFSFQIQIQGMFTCSRLDVEISTHPSIHLNGIVSAACAWISASTIQTMGQQQKCLQHKGTIARRGPGAVMVRPRPLFHRQSHVLIGARVRGLGIGRTVTAPVLLRGIVPKVQLI